MTGWSRTTGSGPVGWSICICSGWQRNWAKRPSAVWSVECSGPAHPGKWRVADLRRYLGLTERPTVPELQLEPELASYDALLSGEVSYVG